MNRIDILREQCDKLNELLAADPAGMNDLMSCGATVNKAFADDSDVPINQDAYGRDVASVMGLICGLTRTDEDHTIVAKCNEHGVITSFAVGIVDSDGELYVPSCIST